MKGKVSSTNEVMERHHFTNILMGWRKENSLINKEGKVYELLETFLALQV